MSKLLNYPGSIHCHTQYSNIRIRDCIIKENDLIDYAIELGHELVAITDHESVSAWLAVEEYYEKIKKEHPDFKVLRGNEIYLVRNGLNADNFNKDKDRYWHFILLACDEIGAKQIMELSTRAWKRSYMARGMRRVPTYYQDLLDIIRTNPGHVIGSNGCLGGVLPTQILRGTPDDKLEIWINQMQSIFGEGYFYFELQPNHNREQIIVNKKLIELSKKLNIPYIITTDAHYLKAEDRPIHKAYLNAQNGEREIDDFYATTYMMNTSELESYFDYLSTEQLQIAYQNIINIKNTCKDFTLKRPLRIPELKWEEHNFNGNYSEWYNKIPMLETFNNSEYEADKELVKAIIIGIQKHKDLQNERAYQELNYNLEMTWESSNVNNARWSAYFLNLQNIINVCWSAGTLVGPSRGSGGGFLLLYCLNIIQINCLRETTQVYPWRFLNPKRASVLDIDVDIEGVRRSQVLSALKQYFGEDRVSNVATFGTEKSKSAILTCGRGLGIDVDIAQYLASLIPADRGQLRSLHECYYGDEEKGFEPIKQFVYEMDNNYPELWEMAQKIEGLICRIGEHAGGVVLVDEPFTESTSLMRAPNGDIITAFELHTIEKQSLIKMDLLSVEAMDKLHNCLDLLCDYGYVKRKPTLRETYEDTIGIYNLERTEPKMWEMVWNHEIQSLFQMEQDSGTSGIAIAHPKTVDELAVLNSVIRLMPSEKGAERPLETWARYRNNINEWYQEAQNYGLTHEQIEWLKNNSAITDGMCESQEGLMSLLQSPELGGNDLSFADKCRKAIAKKQGKLFEECEIEYFKNAEEKGCDMTLVHYVWDVLLKVQRGYSFCRAHTLAYSLVALQEMNLAYKYPILFWDCACLISDAGGDDSEDEDEEGIEENKVEEPYYEEMEWFDDDEDTEVSSYDEDDGENGFPATIVVTASGKKKKKAKATNYGKIASAIGKMKATGVLIESPDINDSAFTFSPSIEDNAILYGLSGITRIGEDLIKNIMDNRPYTGIDDFLSKVKVNKPQMINLIKSGAFDQFGDRTQIMRDYVASISDQKKRITLQNMKMLIDFGLIPEEFDMQRRVFNFNKYIKKMKLGNYYGLDAIAFNFYSSNFDVDKLVSTDETESGFKVLQTVWDNIYQHHMDIIRPFIKQHGDELLSAVNNRLMSDTWDKYCQGNISKWEMDSISCYIHEHELSYVNNAVYDLVDFFELDEQPEVERAIPIKGKMVPLFKLVRIAGTVLDRDKAKKTITLLTPSGVVMVKIYGGVFAEYDKQISVKGPDGKKHVVEKSMFSRGNKIIITGIRQDDSFLAKVYSRTPHHRVEQIVDVKDNGLLEVKVERASVE